ncbi:hypothetical protein [Nonomuraea sp. NPDC049480]|uniref:hypothetical protein n=1 Tax=Nonomuraea sp. NPDC049480 TaxID=3364353 RepID=UPI0037906953
MTRTKVRAAMIASALAGAVLIGGAASADSKVSASSELTASTAGTADSSAASAYWFPCSDGYIRMAAPWKSGRYIKISTIAHCSAYRGPIGRGGHVDARLDQYRGVGVWRNKAHKIHYVNKRAFTVTLQPSWRCSGGNQLYRNHTKGWIAQGGGKAKNFKHSAQRRITC